MATKHSERHHCLIWINIIFFIHTNAQWSDYYGGDGYNNDTYFQSENSIIKQICVRSGQYIDQISVQFSDNTWSKIAGGDGAYAHCYAVNVTTVECFTSITVRDGGWIDSLQFTTSIGQTTLNQANGGEVDVINCGIHQYQRCMFIVERPYKIAFIMLQHQIPQRIQHQFQPNFHLNSNINTN